MSCWEYYGGGTQRRQGKIREADLVKREASAAAGRRVEAWKRRSVDAFLAAADTSRPEGGHRLWALRNALADVLQQAGDPVDAVVSVDIGLHVGKGVILKGHGEVGKFEQSGRERGDGLACSGSFIDQFPFPGGAGDDVVQ